MKGNFAQINNIESEIQSTHPRRICIEIRSFLVACMQLYNPLCPSVGRLVGQWVSHTLTFFYDFISLTSLLLPKRSVDVKYSPCPPAHDFGSRVFGLVFSDFEGYSKSTQGIVFVFASDILLHPNTAQKYRKTHSYMTFHSVLFKKHSGWQAGLTG